MENDNTVNRKKQVENELLIDRESGLKEWEDKRIIFQRVDFRKIKATGKGWESVLALYCFYQDKAKKDGTDQPWANDKYCMKGLNWSRMKFYKYKKVLLEMGCIQVIQKRDATGHRIDRWYVRVNTDLYSTKNCNSRKTVIVQKKDTSTCLKQSLSTEVNTNDNAEKKRTLYFFETFNLNLDTGHLKYTDEQLIDTIDLISDRKDIKNRESYLYGALKKRYSREQTELFKGPETGDLIEVPVPGGYGVADLDYDEQGGA